MEDKNNVNAANATDTENADLQTSPVGDGDAAVTKMGLENATNKEASAVKVAKERLKKDEAQIAKRKRNDEMIKKLLAENKELDKTVKINRNKARNKFGMKIYASTYSILGLSAMEKGCQTESDFDKLKDEIEKRLKSPIAADGKPIDRIRYDSLTFLVNGIIKRIGLPEDSLSKCKNQFEYRELYKLVLGRISQIVADSKK